MSEQQTINPWKYKPWWCQPWSIILTTITLISGSWLVFKIIWLTILVAIPLLIWPQMMVKSGLLNNIDNDDHHERNY
ncbi:MAG: DUF6737 family protein [Dolichospermum sp.]